MSGEPVGEPTDSSPSRKDTEVSATDAAGGLNELSGSETADNLSSSDAQASAESVAHDGADGPERHASAEEDPIVIQCPVEGCGYGHPTSQGLCGHIPNVQDHRHGWNSVDVTPADLHELWCRGTHPDSSVGELIEGDPDARIGTDEYVAVETVRAWLERHDQPLGKLQVYYHPHFSSVQIQPRTYLSDAWEDYKNLMSETDGVYYDGENKRNYCTDEFVDSLPARERGVTAP